MKKDIRHLQVIRDITAFYQISSNFFIRAGKKTLAHKLVYNAFANNLFNNLKNNVKTKKKMPAKKVLGYYQKAFLKARVLVKFAPRFIKKRYREVPTGALISLQKRRVWATLASLVRRSRQDSVLVLENEVRNVIKSSQNSAVLRKRDEIHKKAEAARVFLKRVRLPYYKIKRKKPKKKKYIKKALIYYRDLRAKKLKRIKKPRPYTPWLSKDELYFRRIDLYYNRKSESKVKKRFDWLFKKNKQILFKKRSKKTFFCFC